MRSKFFIGSFVLAFVFAACTGPSFGTPKNDIFNLQRNSIYNFEDIDASASGWDKVPDFLNKIQMNELSDLKIFGGTDAFKVEDCFFLYSKYNESHEKKLSDETCGNNVNEDGTYQDYLPNGPIFMTLKQFDENYLFLHIIEEGLGGNRLFSYTYDLRSGEVRLMDKWPENYFAMPYYFRGSLCFIETYSIPLAQWDIAENAWADFDFSDGEGNESNDIKIEYSADIDSGEPYEVLDASIIRASTEEVLVPSIRGVIPELNETFNTTLTMIPRLSTPETIVLRKVLMSTDAGSSQYYAFDVASKTFRVLSDKEKYGELYDGFCHTEVE